MWHIQVIRTHMYTYKRTHTHNLVLMHTLTPPVVAKQQNRPLSCEHKTHSKKKAASFKADFLSGFSGKERKKQTSVDVTSFSLFERKKERKRQLLSCRWHHSYTKHTVTHCNTLQHTATHTHCNILQHTAMQISHWNTRKKSVLQCVQGGVDS